MKVTMKARISGTRNGQPWPGPGESITVPDDEGRALVEQGLAEAGKAEQNTAPPAGEQKTAEPPKGEKKTKK